MAEIMDSLDDIHLDIDETSFQHFLNNEDTMNIADAGMSPLFLSPHSEEHNQQNHEPFTPISPRGPPSRAAITNQYNFQVEINSMHTNKKKYLYSHILDKIYVDMNCNFPVQFSWDTTLLPYTMYVRATTVFLEESQAEKRVERCIQHVHSPKADSNLSPDINYNVLHSTREFGTQGIYYCGDHKAADSWFSVVVELPPTSGPHTHAYQFVCKNSCSSGINRRPIAIIFTLEDDKGKVFGRRMVGARVCSCLRRDMLKDEESAPPTAGKRRITTDNNKHKPKKVKLEVVEENTVNNLVTLPQLQVSDTKILKTGLTLMLNMEEHKLELLKNTNPEEIARNTEHIEKLRSFINTLPN